MLMGAVSSVAGLRGSLRRPSAERVSVEHAETVSAFLYGSGKSE